MLRTYIVETSTVKVTRSNIFCIQDQINALKRLTDSRSTFRRDNSFDLYTQHNNKLHKSNGQGLSSKDHNEWEYSRNMRGGPHIVTVIMCHIFLLRFAERRKSECC